MPEPVGVPDREHGVADLDVLERTERDRREPGRVGLEHREVAMKLAVLFLDTLQGKIRIPGF